MVKKNDSKLFAFLAILLSVVGFLIALIVKRDDKYVMFYAKQSLILFFVGILVQVLAFLIAIPIVGILAIQVIWVGYILLWIITLINSLSGKMRETPYIGIYAKKIKL